MALSQAYREMRGLQGQIKPLIGTGRLASSLFHHARFWTPPDHIDLTEYCPELPV
ncbi:hypothetical protein BKA67DRAFT_578538 [Truncatella angustata]|uniref:Uncharacterized protein n=1 Tax=Truncatella angustata TaxID=152316 RepID=A0A9P8UCR1_9PEZI|nr:uncharacterized protein BKA67DRAFT_578538 [Truncatella angustata]KAH6647779.1 hypothetical protein BKA67DRAFT_578538 [Truncatella angustata]